MPSKKVIHQTAEQSEKVEVFSPAPPTILGSFSVFGHATVNAREHASQMNKKLPRPHISDFAAAETRPKVSSYHIRHQYPSAYSSYHHSDVKRPQYATEYNEPSYFYEASLRPPPHEQPKTHSHTSLSPTSYYGYEQGQVFHDEKYQKPHKVNNHYRHHPTVYGTQINDYKTTIPPSNHDTTYSYYSSPNSQIDTEYYNENPVEAISLNINPETKLKPVTENNNVHDSLSNYGRPFQNYQSYTTVETLKDNLDPFVTTFPSSSTVETKVRFSDVAQPFRISSYESVPVSSTKPENTQQTYTEEMFPISVTTIDVPTEVETQKIKQDYEEYEPNHHIPFKPSPYDNSNHKITQNAYQRYENNPPVFLPTPSTDISPYLTEPKNEITTLSPAINNFQETNSISLIDNKVVEPSEAYTEIYSTVPIETTTKSRPIKSRRPSRPALPSTTTSAYNHYSDNDYKYQRRRKPSNKVRSRESIDKNNFTRQRTTTTTFPEHEEISVLDYTTELPVIDATINRERLEYTGDKIQPTNVKEYLSEINYPKNIESDERQTGTEEIITTSSSTTMVPTTISTTQITTTTHASIEPGNRLKTKYGNRPRFSIKDYREKLNRATSTTVNPYEIEKTKSVRNETEFKFRRTKPSTTTYQRTTTESPESSKTSSESKFQKYKPRIGTSRYKTTAAPDANSTTTERTNTFKPNTNRYKPGTGKYYSRYRTSTAPPKDIDDNPETTTTKVNIRPKGVFSAKRQPFPLKSKPTVSTIEESAKIDEQEISAYQDNIKTNENEVYPAVLTKKMDDSTTTTISSEEEEAHGKEDDKDTTGLESLRVADLTSSSSNDFHHSSYFKSNKVASKRPLSKITLPTENRILPL